MHPSAKSCTFRQHFLSNPEHTESQTLVNAFNNTYLCFDTIKSNFLYFQTGKKRVRIDAHVAAGGKKGEKK